MFCVFSTKLTLGIRTKDLHNIVRSRRPVVVPTECPPTKNHGLPTAPQTVKLKVVEPLLISIRSSACRWLLIFHWYTDTESNWWLYRWPWMSFRGHFTTENISMADMSKNTAKIPYDVTNNENSLLSRLLSSVSALRSRALAVTRLGIRKSGNHAKPIQNSNIVATIKHWQRHCLWPWVTFTRQSEMGWDKFSDSNSVYCSFHLNPQTKVHSVWHKHARVDSALYVTSLV